MLYLTLLLATTSSGGTGADTFLFTGSVVNSVIRAGSGNDSIVMAGTWVQVTGNTIDLGVGTDTIKFTKATSSDTVTVTSTTITGAKSLTYEKAATGAGITLGAGADVVIFEDTSGIWTIATNSGNDSIQFLKNADAEIDLGAGADSVYGAQIISNSTISGGAGQDTFLISTLSNSSFLVVQMLIPSLPVLCLEPPSTLVLATRTSLSRLVLNASIAGGSGNDTFVVTGSNLQTASTLAGGVGR